MASRAGKILLRAGIAVAVGLVGLELALRLCLFREVEALRRLSIRLRQPGNYAVKGSPEYWTYSVRLTPPERLRPIPGYDPLVGWTGSLVEPGTYAHAQENLVLDRRPVLLFGDSFAECATEPRDCWQGLLARSDRGRTHALLNYGVGGYGFDQTFLLMRAALERHGDANPLVILSLLVDDDLDRAVLPFRGWPKPRFGVEDGRLIEPEPVVEGVEAYLDQRTSAPLLWSLRFVTRRLGMHTPDEAARRAEIQELARALLQAAKAELEARQLEGFVLLFHGEPVLTPAGREATWQHDFLVETLRELDLPFVSSRRALLHEATTTGVSPEAFFIQSGKGRGHYTPRGNAAVFAAIEDGLEGRFH